jgi:hypothetical protein
MYDADRVIDHERACRAHRRHPGMMHRAAGFLVGFVTAAGLAAVVVWLLFWQSGVRLDLSRPTVVRHIQQLQRLETVVYSLEKIVTGSQESRYLPRLLAGDRLLLIVHGEVTAGIDLGRVDASAVRISGRSIALDLPAPEIFSTRIDNERTQVYARETGLFTSPDPNLESEVRREAERQIRQAALDDGILSNAAANARLTLATFVKGLGFEEVEVR